MEPLRARSHTIRDWRTPDEQNCAHEDHKLKAAKAKGDVAVGRVVLWLDKQVLVPLKWENYTLDGSPLHRYEVTSVEFDVDIPESIFTYTPPPGAIIEGLTERVYLPLVRH